MNTILEAAKAISIYGRHMSYCKDHNKLWQPLRVWALKNSHGRKGNWDAEHSSVKSLKKYDPRFVLYMKYTQQNTKQNLCLFKLYDIPAENECTIENIFYIGFNIGLYQGYYDHNTLDTKMYEDDYFNTIFSKNRLGDMNSYIKNNSGIYLHPEEYLDVVTLITEHME